MSALSNNARANITKIISTAVAGVFVLGVYEGSQFTKEHEALVKSYDTVLQYANPDCANGISSAERMSFLETVAEENGLRFESPNTWRGIVDPVTNESISYTQATEIFTSYTKNHELPCQK